MLASEDLENDRDAMLATITAYGYALQSAPEGLKNDRDCVLAAVMCFSLSDLGEAFRVVPKNWCESVVV